MSFEALAGFGEIMRLGLLAKYCVHCLPFGNIFRLLLLLNWEKNPCHMCLHVCVCFPPPPMKETTVNLLTQPVGWHMVAEEAVASLPLGEVPLGAVTCHSLQTLKLSPVSLNRLRRLAEDVEV